MSNSNVIYLREWRDKLLDEPRRRCFASTREIRQLLQAFCAIESALVRAEIDKDRAGRRRVGQR